MDTSKPQIQRLAADTDIEIISQVIETDGALILENLLSADIVNSFNRELDVQLVVRLEGERLLADNYPPHFRYVSNIPAKCETFRHNILNNIVIHAIYKDYFQRTGDCWLSAAFVRVIDPGMPAQNFHRDDTTPLMQYQSLDAPPISISLTFPLSNFTEENVATEVILGSYQWTEVGKPSHEEAGLAKMSPGDILVLRHGVIHAGGRTLATTDEPRRVVPAYFNSCQLAPFET
ncbi:hypothetical protein BDV24DRAFT_161026 [Aspergillus arachidicola]|uniref:Phytanoyl-CoA dioxygenase family protein n=1 Tax=Aspergillus arachidicola TaxID=656916 RepID=A0A5N6YE16_9EURO|nr:hypothetical protein BDV24DRAFT_161026 [Aspergillus arachidicola]